LSEVAAAHGALLSFVDAPERRRRLAELVGKGDREQWADRRWRRELAAWMHPWRRHDGLVTPHLMAPLTRAAITELDLGSHIAARDEKRVATAPILATLATGSDEPRDCVVAGMALEHLLLRAAAEGVRAGYHNQPVQVPALRPGLAHLLERPWYPQIVLRLGYPLKGPQVTPRRPPPIWSSD
jgi:hypothetical protein